MQNSTKANVRGLLGVIVELQNFKRRGRCFGTDDAEVVVRDLTEGYGADVYLDATGHPSAVSQGLNLLRKLGRYVEYGVFGAPVTVDWTVISDVKELDILGAHLGPYCWPTAISTIEAKALPLDRICSHQLPLEEFRAGLDLVGGAVTPSR